MTLNQAQQGLITWIKAGLEIDAIRQGEGDGNYIMSNMIAKIALAADEYYITEGALAKAQAEGYDLTKTLTRATLYGKKKGFVYEHSLPCSIIREALKADPENADEILEDVGVVVIVTREEDDLLNSQYKNTRPNTDTFGRYDAMGIAIADQKVRVKGAIKR